MTRKGWFHRFTCQSPLRRRNRQFVRTVLSLAFVYCEDEPGRDANKQGIDEHSVSNGSYFGSCFYSFYAVCGSRLRSIASNGDRGVQSENKMQKMSDEKAQELREVNSMLKWEYVATWNTSKYDLISNRCYGRIYDHMTKQNFHLDHENDAVYDLQTDDFLAAATIENGKKNGSIWDADYKKDWLPSCVGGCPSNFGDQTWQAAEDYMNELMADPRKQ
jgi:hypothetical protein